MKKPPLNRGYPPDQAWVKAVTENVETITGRRGNKIAVPGAQVLTFSATPTKAQCEALNAYVNTVRSAVEKLILRLDE